MCSERKPLSAKWLAKPTKWLASGNAGRGACDTTQIHAPAPNKPFGAGTSHFGKPKTSLSTRALIRWSYRFRLPREPQSTADIPSTKGSSSSSSAKILTVQMSEWARLPSVLFVVSSFLQRPAQAAHIGAPVLPPALISQARWSLACAGVRAVQDETQRLPTWRHVHVVGRAPGGTTQAVIARGWQGGCPAHCHFAPPHAHSRVVRPEVWASPTHF
ncbi:hypothetical protein DFH09DRAFT_1076779 [Mycena vulgaris]|nr:hypothetical protein DFH09DRAFT_1076779 [Mycena vulgaris]